jgi:hypothetical protein
MFKVYARKIEIYTKGKGILNQWQYECSTNASWICKEAREKFSLRYGIDPSQVKANFAK